MKNQKDSQISDICNFLQDQNQEISFKILQKPNTKIFYTIINFLLTKIYNTQFELEKFKIDQFFDMIKELGFKDRFSRQMYINMESSHTWQTVLNLFEFLIYFIIQMSIQQTEEVEHEILVQICQQQYFAKETNPEEDLLDDEEEIISLETYINNRINENQKELNDLNNKQDTIKLAIKNQKESQISLKKQNKIINNLDDNIYRLDEGIKDVNTKINQQVQNQENIQKQSFQTQKQIEKYDQELEFFQNKVETQIMTVEEKTNFEQETLSLQNQIQQQEQIKLQLQKQLEDFQAQKNKLISTLQNIITNINTSLYQIDKNNITYPLNHNFFNQFDVNNLVLDQLWQQNLKQEVYLSQWVEINEGISLLKGEIQRNQSILNQKQLEIQQLDSNLNIQEKEQEKNVTIQGRYLESTSALVSQNQENMKKLEEQKIQFENELKQQNIFLQDQKQRYIQQSEELLTNSTQIKILKQKFLNNYNILVDQVESDRKKVVNSAIQLLED